MSERFKPRYSPQKYAKLAYEIFPRFWQQGFAREAVVHMMKVLVLKYQLNRMLAEIDVDNLASIALIKSLGFKLTKITKAAKPEAVYVLNLS